MASFNLERLLAREDLNTADKIVLLKLIKQGGRGSASQERLAKECSLSVKTFERAVRKFKKYGIIYTRSEYAKTCILNLEVV